MHKFFCWYSYIKHIKNKQRDRKSAKSTPNFVIYFFLGGESATLLLGNSKLSPFFTVHLFSSKSHYRQICSCPWASSVFYTSNQFQSSLDPQLFIIDYDLMASLTGMERLTIPEGSPPWIRYCCLHIASYSRRNQQVPDFVFFRGIVRFQSNVEDHDPEVCSKNLTAWEDIESQCSTPPHFVPFGMNVSFNF